MADPKSRARVERMMRGDFRPDDLTGLFLYARDHCDGRETVADIGHFVAHHNERDRGIITRSTRRWFAVAQYHLPRFRPGGPYPLRGDRLPTSTRDYYRLAVNLMDPKHMQEATGLRRSKAQDIMSTLADRLTKNPDGSWSLPRICTSDEIKMIKYVSSLIVVKPAFESKRLVEEFISTLKSNGLITNDEIKTHHDEIKILVLLYAISAMHNCVIQINGDTKITLKARSDLSNKQIAINASVPIDIGINVVSSVFVVDLDPSIYCHEELNKHNNFDFEIELTTNKQLSPLR